VVFMLVILTDVDACGLWILHLSKQCGLYQPRVDELGRCYWPTMSSETGHSTCSRSELLAMSCYIASAVTTSAARARILADPV
jgi:hypothetical protein